MLQAWEASIAATARAAMAVLAEELLKVEAHARSVMSVHLSLWTCSIVTGCTAIPMQPLSVWSQPGTRLV